VRIIQYGLRLPDGTTVKYATEEQAQGARGRFERFPATRNSVLIEREVDIGEWREVRG
jgi:hypothetical protein